MRVTSINVGCANCISCVNPNPGALLTWLDLYNSELALVQSYFETYVSNRKYVIPLWSVDWQLAAHPTTHHSASSMK
jgi:hypothetical protein